MASGKWSPGLAFELAAKEARLREEQQQVQPAAPFEIVSKPRYRSLPYLPVPHFVFDLFPTLNPTEQCCLLLILRKTLGFSKDKDIISASQFSAYSGRNRSKVLEALASLENRKIIRTFRSSGASNAYQLVLPDVD